MVPPGFTVLLVELSQHHDEVLCSMALDILDAGGDVVVACPRAMWDRLPLHGRCAYEAVDLSGGYPSRLQSMIALRRSCRRMNVDMVIFVTATGTAVRDMAHVLRRRRQRIVGVLHDVGKLSGSVNQWIANKAFDALVVLAPHLARLARPSTSLPVHTIPATAIPPHGPRPDVEGTLIAIPGNVLWSRRDYGILETLLADRRLPSSLRFVVLGDAGGSDVDQSRLRQVAQAWAGRMLLFDHFVPHEECHAWLARSSAVLPLVHPGLDDAEAFLHRKISGAFSAAWAHGLPLLLHDMFRLHPELGTGAQFYSDVPSLTEHLAALPPWTPERSCVVGPWPADRRRAAVERLITDHRRPIVQQGDSTDA